MVDSRETRELHRQNSSDDEDDGKWEKEAVASLMGNLAHATEEQVVPCVGAAIDYGMACQLEKYLEEFISEKETEIDRFCNKHFVDFLNSVHVMVDMREDAEGLKKKIENLNSGLQTSGRAYLEQGVSLLRQKEMMLKIRETQSLVLQARELVDLIAVAEAQMHSKRYYAALDTWEGVKEMAQGVRAKPLMQMLENWVPSMVTWVKEAALKDVSSWLVEARDKAQSVGETALCRCAWQGGVSTGVPASPSSRAGIGGRDEKTTFSLRFLHRLEETVGLELEDLYASEIYSWVPEFLLPTHDRELDSTYLDNLPEKLAVMHRGLHIFHRLGDLLTFRQKYTSGRKAQSELPSLLPGEDLKGMPTSSFLAIFPTLIQRLSGFFLIEDALLEAVDYPSGLMSRGELETLWEERQEDLISMLERRLQEVSTPTEFLQVKEVVFVLARTMGEDGLHLKTVPLIHFLKKMFQIFGGIQIVHLEIACHHVLAEETHQPMTIVSEEEYMSMARLGLLLDDTLEEGEDLFDDLDMSLRIPGESQAQLEFPMSVPFSKCVPALARELHRFTIRTLFYAASLTTHRMGKALMSAVDTALNHTSGVVNEKLEGEVPIAQVVQISINAGYLAQIPHHLEALVQEGVQAILWHQIDEEEVAELHLTPNSFAGISTAAHAATFELIQRKLVDLISGINFVNFEAQKAARATSSYVEDVTGYLRVTFMCSTHLSSTDREAIHFYSCSNIHNTLLLHLLEEVPKVNMIGMYNFSRDLLAFEEFASECGVPGLQECFAELRQLCNAVLNPNFTDIMADRTAREEMYPKLDPSKLITILQKYEGLSMIAKIKQKEGKDFPQLDKKAVQQVIRDLQNQGF